jgi:hypothetical protein
MGAVKIKKDNNNNNQINVSTRHLASPEKLTPSKSSYVVWMETIETEQKYWQVE